MCTMIAQQAQVAGRGKAGTGWFTVDNVSVSYDHPFDLPSEYALNLDFTNLHGSVGDRVAVELDAASARKLLETLQQVLQQAEQGGFLKP